MRGAALAVLMTALTVQPAVAMQDDAAIAELETTCLRDSDQDWADRMIAACTALIDGGRGDPGDIAEYLYRRANAYEEIKEYEAALADYDAAIALRPDHDDTWLNRGLTRRRSGDVEGALADYAEVLRINPANALARTNRAFIAIDLERYDEAIRDLKPQAEGDPNDWAANFNLGAAYAYNRQYDAARAAFEVAFANGPAWLTDDYVSRLSIFGHGPASMAPRDLAAGMTACIRAGDC